MSAPIHPPNDPVPTIWFHGSPLSLSVLRAGSTITPRRELARVFSHKPAIVSLDEGADGLQLRHNGQLAGFLYLVEDVRPEDVYPHPNSSMQPGLEWLTRRDLPLRLLGATQVRAEEFLTPANIEQLRQDHGQAS